MSTTNSGWVLTSERKPTADDADEVGHLWVQEHSGHIRHTHWSYVAERRCVPGAGDVWHPKPKAEKPEPYKPPVQERVEVWVVSCKGYDWHSKHARLEDAIDMANRVDGRVFHLREVRDGDPSPEDVAAVRTAMGEWLRMNSLHNLYCDIKGWLRLLGEKP